MPQYVFGGGAGIRTRVLPPLDLLHTTIIYTILYLPLFVKLTRFRHKYTMKHKHHIIPKHAGGTDELTNIIELSIEEHAEAHKQLFEKYNRWQDYVAWQGLSGLDENFDAVKMSIVEGGKMGADKSNRRWSNPEEKIKQSNRMKLWASKRNYQKTWKGKSYEITFPCGRTEIITGLSEWCLENNLNANTLANSCLRGTKTKDGYFIKKI